MPLTRSESVSATSISLVHVTQLQPVSYKQEFQQYSIYCEKLSCNYGRNTIVEIPLSVKLLYILAQCVCTYV